MKNGTVIIIVLVLLIGIGLIFYFTQDEKEVTHQPTSGGGKSVPVTGDTKKTSIVDLFKGLFKKDKAFVQTPPIDGDGIDAKGYDKNGFFVGA